LDNDPLLVGGEIMNDVEIALFFFAMMLSPCLAARAICISERRATAQRLAEQMRREHPSGSWRVSTAR